jgi:hypothetical protein
VAPPGAAALHPGLHRSWPKERLEKPVAGPPDVAQQARAKASQSPPARVKPRERLAAARRLVPARPAWESQEEPLRDAAPRARRPERVAAER